MWWLSDKRGSFQAVMSSPTELPTAAAGTSRLLSQGLQHAQYQVWQLVAIV